MEIEIKNIIPFIITQNYIQDLYTENNNAVEKGEETYHHHGLRDSTL